MKKNKYILGIIILLSGAFSSCDLDTAPTDAVESKLVFENAKNAEKVLNGTWAYLMDTYFSYQNPGWTSLLRASDALGNDVAMQPGKYGYLAHYSFTNISSTSSSTASAVWTLGYKTIDNANHLITKIDALPGDEVLKVRVKSQALALRGYIYLNFATFYSFSYSFKPDTLCVPIYTEPTTLNTEGQPRKPLREVYKQAENDLLSAYNTIGSYNRNGSKHKFDKNVIAGLLARLYLQTNNWVDAQKYAAIAHANYSWMSKDDYLSGFNSTANAEWIWGHGQTADQSTASYSFNYLDVSSSASYYYSFMADPYFKDYFKNDEGDIRTQLFEWDGKRYIGGLMYKKFRFKADNTADIVLLRKAEMVLIEAEAYAEQGKLAEAIERLNQLRTVRGAKTPDLSSLSKQDLIEAILIERRKELFGEGFSLSDILRRQKAVERKAVPNGTTITIGDKVVQVKGHTVLKLSDGTAFVPNNKYYLFAIPATETQNNPNL